mgnify:CR=1 FL=1
MIKDVEIRRLSWIIWVGPKCNYKCSYKKESEGDLITVEEKVSVSTEIEIATIQPEAKECRQPLEVKKARNKVSLEPPEATNPADTLI